MNAITDQQEPRGRPRPVRIVIRRIDEHRPKAWLLAGIDDFRDAPVISLGYGLFWTLLSLGVTFTAFALGLWHWLLPLLAGFLFLGPLVAVGTYGVSRRLADGQVPMLRDVLAAWTAHTGQLAMMGVMLMIFFLAWIRLASLLFALFFGWRAPDPVDVYVLLFTTAEGLAMLAVGTGIGALLAFGAFAIGVVAIPTLLDRDLTFMEGIEASVRSVAVNFRPLLLWAAILTGCTLIGFATGYLGLAVILPVLGYASWHAYVDLVGLETDEPGEPR